MSQSKQQPIPRSTPTEIPPPPYTPSTTTDAQSPVLTPSSSIASLRTTRTASPVPETSKTQPFLNDPADPADPSDSSHPEQDPRSTIPSDIQRVKAPLLIKQNNSSIIANYLVLKDDAHSGKPSGDPDISLQTSNGKIASAVYVEDNNWSRPVAVEACTKNGSVTMAVVSPQTV